MRRRKMIFKTQKTPEQKMRGRYRFYKYGFFVLLVMLGATLFSQYDYLAFKFLITGHYIYTDALDQVYKETIGENNFKSYWRNFDQLMIASVTEKIRSVSQDRYTYLYTPQTYQQSKDTEKADAKTATIKPLSEKTVYLYVPNISDLSRQFFTDHKAELAQYDNLVLDLRSNYGGLLADAYTMADLFLDKKTVIGYEKTRLSWFTRTIRASGRAYFSFEHIVILQDKNTASAAEGLILALKANLPNVTLLGETTFGKGIGQVTIPLKDQFHVRATVLLLAGPDGKSIHGVGISPDIVGGADWETQALTLVEPNAHATVTVE